MFDDLLVQIKINKYFTEENIIQINEYLEGKRKIFDIQKIDGTDFQKTVWEAISKIPYGQTKTYKELAYEIGRPKAVRAVGTACGANKICIVIPCHRVIASNGSLGGYVYGLEIKKKLLDLERGNLNIL